MGSQSPKPLDPAMAAANVINGDRELSARPGRLGGVGRSREGEEDGSHELGPLRGRRGQVGLLRHGAKGGLLALRGGCQEPARSCCKA